MPKKTLQQWLNKSQFREILNAEQKLSELGISLSTGEYDLSDLKKLCRWYDVLEANRGSLEDFSGTVQQITFGNNYAIIIHGEGGFNIKLVFCKRDFEGLEKFVISSSNYEEHNLNSAKNEVLKIEEKLSGKHPILYNEPAVLITSYSDDYSDENFPSVFKNREVERTEVNFYSAKNNPNAYFKPLDIVKIFQDRRKQQAWKGGQSSYMVHAGVYLGGKVKKICHTRYDENSKNGVIKLENWNNFFILPNADKIIRYRPIVTFKRPEKIVEHIAKCVEGRYFDAEFGGFGGFNIWTNNCEHFANRCVYGLNFSELEESRKKPSKRLCKLNSEEIKKCLRDNEDKLGSLIVTEQQNKVNDEISQIIKNNSRDIILMETKVETRPTPNYRLN